MKIFLYIPDYGRFLDYDAENDDCRYARECAIGCQQCRYFEQKGDEQKGDAE